MSKLAVVTPYFKEPLPVLRQCHESVISQSVAADHFLVADGHPLAEVDRWNAKHVCLPSAHGDNGNTPRGIGGVLASAEEYEFVAYLDADNWFHPGHLESLLELHGQSGAQVCSSFRTFHTLEGVQMAVQDEEEERLLHVDTSCFLLHQSAFDLLDLWLRMPRPLSPICDRVFYRGLVNKGYALSSTRRRTVAFRSQYEVHYRLAGLPPPENAKRSVGTQAYTWLLTGDGLREAHERLGFSPI